MGKLTDYPTSQGVNAPDSYLHAAKLEIGTGARRAIGACVHGVLLPVLASARHVPEASAEGHVASRRDVLAALFAWVDCHDLELP